MNNAPPLARKNGLVVQELPDEVLVYDASNDKAHCLNQSAALVWKYCDGTKQVPEIAKLIGRELNANVKEEFVWLALDQLEKELLLEENNFSLKSIGISRREVIKRVGLASVVALPIVTSLLNPLSARAAVPCTFQCPVNGTPEAITCVTQSADPLAIDPPGCQAACDSNNQCIPNT